MTDRPTDSVIPLSAERLIGAMSAQLDRLRQTVHELEESLGRELEHQPELPAQAILSLQHLDRSRQSLSDIARVLDHAAPMVQWKDGTSIGLHDLQNLVDMQRSLVGLQQTSISDVEHGQDIWL